MNYANHAKLGKIRKHFSARVVYPYPSTLDVREKAMPQLSFTEHPASVGETYGEHMASAWGFAARMALGAGACFVHGIFPFLCLTTGSGTIRELYARMISQRLRPSAQGGFGSLESASL
jgi:hypothetical protein